MKILWVGKKPVSDGEGVEIYDRKMIAACRGYGHKIDPFYPTSVSRLNEVRNMLLGVPFQRARYATPHNTRDLRIMAAAYDLVICSWEPFDGLPVDLPKPTILITHNISSNALPGLYPNALGRLAAGRVRRWERACYQPKRFYAVGALSQPDLAYLQSINAPRPLLLTPGMPPCVDLKPNSGAVPEWVISGTYDWPPKKRGLLQFAKEYKESMQWPILADNLPAEAGLQTKRLPVGAENGDAIRIGVITDRFTAGHKLKTLAYIANNQVVFTFADVSFDFADIPDHEVFIRKVSSVKQMNTETAILATIPRLYERFTRFKNACAERFTWDAAAATLMTAAEASQQSVPALEAA